MQALRTARDSTSINAAVPDVVAAARRGDVRGLRIGLVKELSGDGYQAVDADKVAELAKTDKETADKITEARKSANQGALSRIAIFPAIFSRGMRPWRMSVADQLGNSR